ncbi:hypothetical protein [Leekyejoonella antrihumi]|uniref:Uncharacterized protein n=1 Tax=Leekyejoonella antrihumi TaxID=1660198 RepID=A0A563DZL2_9MICO|nr:hypothetical protein [Leekyejoonella antrihumi]TWP35708.1 hypothetical protein FGL98_12930 [Leekyejoonella antrihumi]
MSTPLPPFALFDGLLDDAAVFPPGNFPLEEAIARRMRRRGTAAARYVGPLLLPVALIDEALACATPLTISVVGRPGASTGALLAAAEKVVASAGHSLAGIELPHGSDWRNALALGVPLAVEIPAGPDGLERLSDITEVDGQVHVKLRTGSTPHNPVPTPAQLGAFIVGCLSQDLAFKLTGGLHHPITGEPAGAGETQFGFLNVLVATDAALAGAGASAVEDLLASRETDALVGTLRSLSADRAATIRATFHSYGCCDVLDPVHALSDHGLIEERI